MTNTTETKALGFMAEREEQRAEYLDALAVVDALDMAAKRACCLETLAAAVLDDMDEASACYHLAELLALDVSALASEIEAIRDDLGDARHGARNRFAATPL